MDLDADLFSTANFSLKALYDAVEKGDVELVKFVLAPQIFGLENILNAIDEIFDDYSLSKEIFAFLNWKIKENDFEQQNLNIEVIKWGNETERKISPEKNETFGTETQILLHALKNEQNEIAKFLICSNMIDVNCFVKTKVEVPRKGQRWRIESYHEEYPFEYVFMKKDLDLIFELLKRDDLDANQALRPIFKNLNQDDDPNFEKHRKQIITILLDKPNLNLVKLLKASIDSISNDHDERMSHETDKKALKMLITPEFLLKYSSWIKTEAFEYLINCDYVGFDQSWFQQFLENASKIGIDLVEINRPKSTKFLINAIKKHADDLQFGYLYERLIKYMVEKLKFEITQEIIDFAEENDSWLVDYLQSQFDSTSSRESKRRKLN